MFSLKFCVTGVLGAIDGCYIRIEKPQDNPNSYINRKGFPSVVLQGICDHQKLFTDVYAGQPGSLNDVAVFKKSSVYTRINNQSIQFPNNSHLIGDLIYPLSTSLLVGFKDNGYLTQRQINFNQKLAATRVVIENAFGMLKKRFRRLKFVEMKRLDLISIMIVSTCIIHNICILNGDICQVELRPEHQNDINEYGEDADLVAIEKRNNIMNSLRL